MGVLKEFNTKEVNSYVFYQRQEQPYNEDIKRISINVDKNVELGASLFESDKKDPFILYFHGNGEIVTDYDDLGPVFIQRNINFMPVDYRGYGFSTGEPTIVNMLEDAVKISEFVVKMRKEQGFTGPLAVMGRSLGSASALELVSSTDYFDALIIESGFSDFKRLLITLGFYDENFKTLEDPLNHNEKIKIFKKPVLIIHGEKDEIIPFREGKSLFESNESPDKKFVEIKKAGHNSIFMYGMDIYFNEITKLFESL